MKNTTLLILLCLFAFHSSLSAQQNIFPNAKERSSDFENLSAPDSTGKRAKLKSPLLVPNRVETQQIKLPYPVIFIHGLNSGSETWDITTNFMDLQYGFHFGGRIDFCLNFDGNNATANSNFYPAAGADIALFTPLNNLVAGDYYYVNFDVGINGSVHPNGSASDVKSNQSAVVKQGLALRTAIYMVLQATGRDKVILFGHSMGGLASRQYLQNPNIWQPDGKTHVAKLVTTATPHGGSNSTSFGLGIGGVDESSEAVRDLRRTYYYSNNNGVYLFGGVENLSYMNDQLLFNFYNSDVNCNNIGNTNESITGLNQKSIYTNLDYSCIIGECPNCILDIYNGDGVVNNVSANLKNIYPSLNVNLLYYNSNSVSTQIHTEMPKQNYQNIQGLDEPSEFSLSYHIGFDTAYSGFMTVQATNNAYYPVDFDDYKFTVTGNKSVGINVSNITISDLSFTINNSSYQQVGTVHKSNVQQQLALCKTCRKEIIIWNFMEYQRRQAI